ncbi:hypothetical protein KEM56_002934 [Ascosphaera pollenicola]|nr:hypothetical protein KEM56_002934 [Ascosphaera pollenicola]
MSLFTATRAVTRSSLVCDLPPAFLAPSLFAPTGLPVPLHASKFGLPAPAKPEEREPREETPDHGLWGFFIPERERVPSTEYEAKFGRAWTVQELRNKSFDDLHALWWVCAKERNRIATSKLERTRLALGFGDHESGERLKEVRKTQKAIKNVLLERMYAWSEARAAWNDGYRPSADTMYEQ